MDASTVAAKVCDCSLCAIYVKAVKAYKDEDNDGDNAVRGRQNSSRTLV